MENVMIIMGLLSLKVCNNFFRSHTWNIILIDYEGDGGGRKKF